MEKNNKLYRITEKDSKIKHPAVSYICGVDLAHPNFPNEQHAFCVMKKVDGEPSWVVESFNIHNRGYGEDVTKRLEITKLDLKHKYPGIKFIVDKKYRTWKDDEPEKRF